MIKHKKKMLRVGTDEYLATLEPESRKPAFLVYVGTTNDSSGNPRRGWAVYNHQATLLAFFPEEYSGNSVRVALQMIGSKHELPVTGRIDITVGQFRVFNSFARYTPLPE